MAALHLHSTVQRTLRQPTILRSSRLLRKASGLSRQGHVHQKRVSPTASCVASPSIVPQHAHTESDVKSIANVVRVVGFGLCAALWCCIAAATNGSSAFLSVTSAATLGSGLTNSFSSAGAGLAAGALHTLCGADHLAGLTPLTIGRGRLAASLLGALWGFGHSTGQLILGVLMAVLKERFSQFLPALNKWSGAIVALTLVAIGLHGLYEAHFHKDEEEEIEIAGVSADGTATAQRRGVNGLWTYATGIAYGLQPDALFVVIPAIALPKLAAIAYCLTFVLGTVVAMGGYTLLIGTTTQALCKDKPWLQRNLSTLASSIAIAVGMIIGLSGFGLEVPFLHAH